MQTILQHLYKKNTLQEIDAETLQQLTQRQPYFSIGHYLLAKKLAMTGDGHYTDQFQKTLVYFHNPLWLQYLLTLEENPGEPFPKYEEEQTVATTVSHDGDGAVSHDLIEEVLLHQEMPEVLAEEMPDTQIVNAESALIENSPMPVIQIKEEAQTVQHPERFSFQAYHTVDYFASQGIRLSQELQTGDKLGKQLKSFTEWLKTMRRLPESVAEEVLEKINDVEVVQFAADSLEEKDVVTEAMAEVLVKQEKFAKARDVYAKLSLLHPQKNAYFAAKIEDLK